MNIVNAMKTQLSRWLGSTSIVISPRQAGMYVTEERALGVSAVFACVRVISESIAALPWHVYQKSDTDSRARELLPSHPADWMLSTEANPETTSFDWTQFMVSSALLHGNGYSEIERDMAGRPLRLWQLTPDRVTPKRADDGRLIYEVRSDTGGPRILEAADVFHVAGLGYDGLVGYPVIRMAARSIGAAMAGDETNSAYMQNKAQLGGILTTDQMLDADKVKELKALWEEAHSGPNNAGKDAILYGGLKYQGIAMPLKDQEFLEERKFSIREICRWFRVPPHKIADLEDAHFNNIEHQGIEFATDCLGPWCTRLEMVANMKLIGRNQRGRIYTKFNMKALLRGDVTSQSAFYREMRQNGIFSANDVRGFEDMNPVPGGDEYIVQSNMIPVDQLREKVEAEIKKANEPAPAPALPQKASNDESAERESRAEARTTRLIAAMFSGDGREHEPMSISVNMPALTIAPKFNLEIPERQLNLNLQQPDIKVQVDSPVNVQPAAVNVEPAVVNITTPESRIEVPVVVKVAPAHTRVEAPVNVTLPPMETRVEAPVTVNVPASETRIDAPVTVNVPETKVEAPIVNVTTGETHVAAPVVRFAPKIDARIEQPRARKKVRKVTAHNAEGFPIEVTETETD